MTADLREIAALMQLASPALPIGGYSYSQGLEAAIEAGIVSTAIEAEAWIHDVFTGIFSRSEAPLWLLSYRAWAAGDIESAGHWNDYFFASRETSEFRAEAEQMGWSLAQLARSLNWGGADIEKLKPVSFTTAHAYCAFHLGIQAANGLAAYGFIWLENQIAAAMKAMPVGQVAGQQALARLRQVVPEMVAEAEKRAASMPPLIENFSPLLAILSSRHETQYSRLFRS